MKRKKADKKKPPSLRQLILSVGIVVIVGLLGWFQETAQGIHLPEAGAPPSLYSNQTNHDLTKTMVAAIRQAKESIMFIIFSLTDPEIINSLNQKCREGVAVHVVCDAKSSPYISSKLDPRVKTIRRFGPGLMHQKILVIDKKQTWLGSANMTPESLRLHGNLVAAIDSAQLANAIVEKGNTLHEEGKDQSFLHEKFTIGGQQVELWFLPDNTQAAKRIKNLIDSAKKTLRIAMFTWTRQDLAHAVIAASKRGVQTEVVIDHSSGKGTSSKIVELLKKNGIPTSLNDSNSLLHHKFAYIDGKTLVNGSANWTKAAFTRNDDCFMILHNLTQDQKNQMDNLWKAIKEDSAPVP